MHLYLKKIGILSQDMNHEEFIFNPEKIVREHSNCLAVSRKIYEQTAELDFFEAQKSLTE